MLILITTFIATFVTLSKGLMVLLGVLFGGVAFVLVLFALLVAGVSALIESCSGRCAHAHAHAHA
ncbi:MAG: hypothetical protein HKL99_09230 [Burkholderiales bacterium]|nr:hypothetical protein [Burkholderiales bacterium]